MKKPQMVLTDKGYKLSSPYLMSETEIEDLAKELQNLFGPIQFTVEELTKILENPVDSIGVI